MPEFRLRVLCKLLAAHLDPTLSHYTEFVSGEKPCSANDQPEKSSPNQPERTSSPNKPANTSTPNKPANTLTPNQPEKTSPNKPANTLTPNQPEESCTLITKANLPPSDPSTLPQQGGGLRKGDDRQGEVEKDSQRNPKLKLVLNLQTFLQWQIASAKLLLLHG